MRVATEFLLLLLCAGIAAGIVHIGIDDNAAARGVAPFPSCNVGPMHHSHLILPLEATKDACTQDTARFLLSHGATFFCPHTWDVKLLASIVDDDARATLCESFFAAVEGGEAATHAFRPTLEQGGLPAEALGQLTSWESPVMYWIHSFGSNNSAGPDDGWNLTTIRSDPTTVLIDRVLYSRQFDLQPAPAVLTYLVYEPQPGSTIVLSHYISTGGESGFDHLVTVSMARADGKSLRLRASWPLYLTLPDHKDSFAERLRVLPPGATYKGQLHVYDEQTSLPTMLEVKVTVHLDYYYGQSDGFAGFGTVCPQSTGSSPSPTLCYP